jgi:hypothetical protein
MVVTIVNVLVRRHCNKTGKVGDQGFLSRGAFQTWSVGEARLMPGSRRSHSSGSISITLRSIQAGLKVEVPGIVSGIWRALRDMPLRKTAGLIDRVSATARGSV